MSKKKRIFLHLAFWLVYYGLYVFNELFISPSFTAHPSLELALSAMTSQLLTLAVKVPAAYIFLYLLLPWWLAAKQKYKVVLSAAFVLLAFAILHRAMVQGIIWRFVYEEGVPSMNALQQTARVLYSTLDLLQIIAITMSIKLFGTRLKAIKKEKALVQEKLQSEILHLKAQINPHFLFNSLNSIYALARSRSERTSETVMRLSKILRYVIYETSKETVEVGAEIKVMEEYMALQQMRFGDRVRIKLNREIDNPGTQITPLLMLPLLENAYKHGAEEVPGTIEMEVDIRLEKGQLEVRTKNPLSSTHPENNTDEQPSGIGLSNIRRQLELLYKDFQLRHEQQNGVFLVHLRINLTSYAGSQLLDR